MLTQPIYNCAAAFYASYKQWKTSHSIFQKKGYISKSKLCHKGAYHHCFSRLRTQTVQIAHLAKYLDLLYLVHMYLAEPRLKLR